MIGIIFSVVGLLIAIGFIVGVGLQISAGTIKKGVSIIFLLIGLCVLGGAIYSLINSIK